MTGNGNYVSLQETSLEKLVKSLQINIFLADFRHLEPLCRRRSLNRFGSLGAAELAGVSE